MVPLGAGGLRVGMGGWGAGGVVTGGDHLRLDHSDGPRLLLDRGDHTLQGQGVGAGQAHGAPRGEGDPRGLQGSSEGPGALPPLASVQLVDQGGQPRDVGTVQQVTRERG